MIPTTKEIAMNMLTDAGFSLSQTERMLSLVGKNAITSAVMNMIPIYDAKKDFHTSAWRNGYLQALKDIQNMNK